MARVVQVGDTVALGDHLELELMKLLWKVVL